MAACSGLLTLPVVVINKGSCKTLGRQRTERRAPCFACLLDNGDGGIYFPPMLLLLCFPQKRVDFEMKTFLLILVRIQVYLEIGSPWEKWDWIRLGQVGLGLIGFDGGWYGSNNYSAER